VHPKCHCYIGVIDWRYNHYLNFDKAITNEIIRPDADLPFLKNLKTHLTNLSRKELECPGCSQSLI
jgi:hypothetical protein